MGFDFVNTRMSGVTGPVTITSGSVVYAGLNANLTNIATLLTSTVTGSGSLIVRNGFIIAAGTTLTSSARPF